MSNETGSYSEARARLEEIVTEVRRKEVSLEKSLDLLEEASRLASRCTELIDQADPADLAAAGTEPSADSLKVADGEPVPADSAQEPAGDSAGVAVDEDESSES